MEIKKEIEGYPKYYISNLGKVYSTKGKVTRELKQYLSNCGYKLVKLSNNGKQRIFNVHRLVAEAFITNHNNFNCVDHINGDRTDNRVQNLRWCSASDNHNFRLARDNHRVSNKENIKSESSKRRYQYSGTVYQYSGETLITSYTSTYQAEKLNKGWNHQGVSIAIQGGYKTKNGWVNVNQYKGYTFTRKAPS